MAKPVAFRDAVLDEHGTIQAGINVLHRAFALVKKGDVFYGSRAMPVWKFGAKLNEKDIRDDCFDLWVIAEWSRWNKAGYLWDDRNDHAMASEVSLGSMSLGAFHMRCVRLGLRYIR